MAGVTYHHVVKKFGDVVAVNDLNFNIDDKEFLVLPGSICFRGPKVSNLMNFEL